MSSLPEASYHLEPGYIYASSQGDVIRTILGSCVAVCLWDAKHLIGGMCHYLYPVVEGRDKATAQYGNVALPALLRLMTDCGALREHLSAQIYGGAASGNVAGAMTGVRNVDVAEKILAVKGIAVVSQDTGGSMGRKLLFDTRSGQVAVLKVHQLRSADWHG